MTEGLLEQFEDSLTDLSQGWLQYQRLQGGHCKMLMSQHELNKVFLCIISSLQKITDSEPDFNFHTLPQILRQDISHLKEIALNQKFQATSSREFISNIKHIRSFFETRISCMIVSDTTILKLSRNLCHLVDCFELEILKWWERTEHQEAISTEALNSRELVKEKATYKSIFDSTSNLVLITDGTGRVIEINPEAKNRFSDQNMLECFCWDVLGLPGTSIEQILEYIPLDTVREISIPSSSGLSFFNLQAKPLSQVYPVAEGVLLILSDITCAVDHRQALEHKVIERTRDLTKSQKILDTIFQSVGKGILLLDNDLEIVKANMMASEMYGIPLEVLVGTSYQALTDEEGRWLMTQAYDALTDGEIRSIECLSTYVDGRMFPSMITVASMKLDGQDFWPIVVSDISKQKELEKKLVNQRLHAEEMNVTLRNVLATIEEQREEFEHSINRKIRSSLLPGIAKIAKENDEYVRSSYLNLLKSQLVALTANFEDPLDGDLLKLSKTELRICQFIRAGLTGKEICDTMNIAFETIQSHRKNIRKKLELRGKDVNLYTFLAGKNLELK